MGSSNIQISRLPLTVGGFSCLIALVEGLASHTAECKSLLLVEAVHCRMIKTQNNGSDSS